jgi:hypothetical protein
MPAIGQTCSSHPGVTAEFQCDGCERLLCEDCIDAGHRLLFCRHCGERALPVTEDTPADTRELSRQRARSVPYSLQDALRYPFRGVGGNVFWGTFALLALFVVIESVVVFGFMLLLIPRLLIALLVPGFLFAIARSTARGDDELPEWPDLFDGERLREFLSALVLGVYSVLPSVVLILVAGCGPIELLEGDPGCWSLLAVGLALGFLLWVPAFAGVAAFGAGPACLRLDLHLRVLVATWPETVRVAGLTLGLALAGELLSFALSAVPVLGSLAGLWLELYALMVGTHLIGLLLRKHEQDLEPIYCH